MLVGIDYVSICTFSYASETLHAATTVENLRGHVGTYLGFSTLCRLDPASFVLFLGSGRGIETFPIKVCGDDSIDSHSKDSKLDHQSQKSAMHPLIQRNSLHRDSLPFVHEAAGRVEVGQYLDGFAKVIRKRLMSA